MVIDRADSLLGATVSTALGDPPASRLEEEVTRWFDEWRDPLLRYVVAMGLPVEEGEEVIQETFLSLFHHLRLGKPRPNLRGWMFRVSHNLALKRRYATGRKREEPVDGSAYEVEDPSPNPEQAFASKQRQTRLLAVLGALPEQDRYCLHLRAEGLRYREIAEVLRMSLGGVAFSLARSLDRLRRADR